MSKGEQAASKERIRAIRKLMNSRMPEPEEMDSSLEKKAATGSKRAWGEADGTFWGTVSSHDTIPAGVYRMGMEPSKGEVFIRQQNDTDSLVELPDSESEKVLTEIDEFTKLRPKFDEFGFLYKRGILLWGPPGSGKTCTIQLALRRLVTEGNGIGVLVDHPGIASTCLQTLRRIEPERQVVALLEDLDSLCQQYEESQYLSLLDGESQINNIIFIATTNYPEKLDKRFLDRPSRFDTVRYVGMPTAAARRAYLVTKLPKLEPCVVDEMVSVSDGFSIAHLRELTILTQCFGMTVAKAAKRLEEHRQARPNSERNPNGPAFGFGGGVE